MNKGDGVCLEGEKMMRKSKEKEIFQGLLMDFLRKERGVDRAYIGWGVGR